MDCAQLSVKRPVWLYANRMMDIHHNAANNHNHKSIGDYATAAGDGGLALSNSTRTNRDASIDTRGRR